MDELRPLIEFMAAGLMVCFPLFFTVVFFLFFQLYSQSVIISKNFVFSLGKCIENKRYMNATRQCNKLLEKSPLARWAKQIILARDDAAAAEKIIEGASKKSRDVSESLKRFDVALVSMMLLSLMLFGAILMYGGWGIGWVVYGVLFAIAVDYWILLRCFKIRGEIETFFEEAPVHLKALRTYIEKYG